MGTNSYRTFISDEAFISQNNSTITSEKKTTQLVIEKGEKFVNVRGKRLDDRRRFFSLLLNKWDAGVVVFFSRRSSTQKE